MPHLMMFLVSTAGGCLFGLFTILLVRDVEQTRLFNLLARHYRCREKLFRLLLDYTLGGLTFEIALGFFAAASVIGFTIVRDLIW
ncbi:MAG: hypothetical protein Q7R85_04615 [bacterium]|nr:hypothetical protein [bacterium]